MRFRIADRRGMDGVLAVLPANSDRELFRINPRQFTPEILRAVLWVLERDGVGFIYHFPVGVGEWGHEEDEMIIRKDGDRTIASRDGIGETYVIGADGKSLRGPIPADLLAKMNRFRERSAASASRSGRDKGAADGTSVGERIEASASAAAAEGTGAEADPEKAVEPSDPHSGTEEPPKTRRKKP